MQAVVRPARVADVADIARLVDPDVRAGTVLGKPTVALYEDVQEFTVAEDAGEVVACGALHVLWADLAEVRTLVVSPAYRGRGVGGAVLRRLVERAAGLGVARLFCLTFEVGFFAAHGFAPIAEVPVPPDVYAELLKSYDEGVAEFLDLARVKPNTLGNTRMLREL